MQESVEDIFSPETMENRLCSRYALLWNLVGVYCRHIRKYFMWHTQGFMVSSVITNNYCPTLISDGNCTGVVLYLVATIEDLKHSLLIL